MKTHYFSQAPQIPSDPSSIRIFFQGTEYLFETDRGVFSKDRMDHGSMTLLKAALEGAGGKVLDFGCGYGAVGILLAKHSAIDLAMVEINPRAALLADKNASRHGVSARIFCQDGLSGIEENFDLILFNPPVRSGKGNVQRLFAEALEHRKEEGRLLIVLQKKQGLASAETFFKEQGNKVTTLARSAGFHVLEITRERKRQYE